MLRERAIDTVVHSQLEPPVRPQLALKGEALLVEETVCAAK